MHFMYTYVPALLGDVGLPHHPGKKVKSWCIGLFCPSRLFTLLSLQDKTLKRLVCKRGEWVNHVPGYWRPVLFIPCNFAGDCFSSEGIMQLSGESCPLKLGVLFWNQPKFKLIRVRSSGGGRQGWVFWQSRISEHVLPTVAKGTYMWILLLPGHDAAFLIVQCRQAAGPSWQLCIACIANSCLFLGGN